MLDFQPKKPRNTGGFTLDPVERERAKGQGSGRRYAHTLFMIGIIVVTGILMYDFMNGLRNGLAPVTNKLNQELPLEAMPKPSIATLPPLADDAAIAEHRATVNPTTVPLWIEQPDAPTLAWVETVLKQDLATPPLPQRVEGRDLLLRHVKVGQNLVVSGLLEDSQPAPIAGAATGYQRLLVAMPDEQYLEVLAPESTRDLLIGEEIVVVGRFLGFATLPVAELPPAAPVPPAETPAGTTAPAPTNATPPPTSVQVPLIAARHAAKPAVTRAVDNPYVMRGEWRMPADIYQNVDDDLLVVETRPYYFTLGQVLLDRATPEVFAKAESANATATAIHREPAKYRGQPFTIRGHVFHAWEDPGVTHDQPFGVSRVVRVILWSEDWGEWDVNEGGEVKTKRKLILRAFELAAITHQPLPKIGDIVTANGRFLRVRSMEVQPNAERDRRMGIKRHSDRAMTFMFVTNDFTVMAPRTGYDFSLLGLAFVIFAAVLIVIVLVMLRREGRKKEEVFDTVRKLRESRRSLKDKRLGAPAAGAVAASPSEAPAAPDGSSTTPPDEPPKTL